MQSCRGCSVMLFSPSVSVICTTVALLVDVLCFKIVHLFKKMFIVRKNKNTHIVYILIPFSLPLESLSLSLSLFLSLSLSLSPSLCLCLSVCVSVCLSVCLHHCERNESAQEPRIALYKNDHHHLSLSCQLFFSLSPHGWFGRLFHLFNTELSLSRY